MSRPLEIVYEIRYELYLVFLEPSLVISMISRIDGRVLGVCTLFMAGMTHKCLVVPWQAMLLIGRNLWTTSVPHYTSSSLG